MINLKRVDIQLLLIFMLIFPGLSYLYFFHPNLYMKFDIAKLLVSAISISVPLIFMVYIIRVTSPFYRLLKMDLSLISTLKKVMKQEKIVTSLLSKKQNQKNDLSSIKREITKSKKEVFRLNREMRELGKDIYQASLAIDIPISIMLVFVAAVITQTLNYYLLHLNSINYLSLLILSTLLIGLISRAIMPEGREYYTQTKDQQPTVN